MLKSLVRSGSHISRKMSTNVNMSEINKFGLEANDWWEKATALLKSNAVRVPYIRGNVKRTLGVENLKGVSIVDVGCGGGFLSEALARTGASVIGIDPGEKMVTVARSHQSLDPSISSNLKYENCSIDDLAKKGEQFDVAVASEVVEHVSDLGDFLAKLSEVVKPGGSLFITTINRTSKSYWFAIIAAEYLLRIVPAGTHSWEQFVTPNELQNILEKHQMSLASVQGTSYNPLMGHWYFTSDTDVNYMAHFLKAKKQ